MIKIIKNRPPRELALLKGIILDPNNPFDNTTVKNKVRSQLLIEQKEICAYCMCRITMENSVIEHILPKNQFQELSRDYNNLLLTCNNENNHCDKSKGDRRLNKIGKHIFLEIESKIKYSNTGNIESPDDQIYLDINNENLLNLNGSPYLIRNRKKIIEEIEKIIYYKKSKEKFTKEKTNLFLNKLIKTEIKRDKLSAFSGVYLYTYKKYIRP